MRIGKIGTRRQQGSEDGDPVASAVMDAMADKYSAVVSAAVRALSALMMSEYSLHEMRGHTSGRCLNKPFMEELVSMVERITREFGARVKNARSSGDAAPNLSTILRLILIEEMTAFDPEAMATKLGVGKGGVK